MNDLKNLKPARPLKQGLDCSRASRGALLPLLVAMGALAESSANAQVLYAETLAGQSNYQYNTIQGLVSSSGTSGGSVGTGGGTAVSFSSWTGGDGAFRGSMAATASADYATAGLHATVTTDGFSEGRAYAQLNDTVVFNVAGANANTVTRIGIDLTLSGTVSEMRNLSYGYAMKLFGQGGGASVGWTTVLYDTVDDPRNYAGWAVSGGTGAPDGFESWELLAGTVTEKHLHGVFSFTGAQRSFDLILGFSLNCRSGTDCDFGNSGHLNFTLPAGVSFTSASGLLLSAVPEPASGAMLLTGFGLLGLMLRRQRIGAERQAS